MAEVHAHLAVEHPAMGFVLRCLKSSGNMSAIEKHFKIRSLWRYVEDDPYPCGPQHMSDRKADSAAKHSLFAITRLQANK